jgi:hypothetical protein
MMTVFTGMMTVFTGMTVEHHGITPQTGIIGEYSMMRWKF